VLCGLYAAGGLGWLLGFVALVPWLRTLDQSASLARTLLMAWAMTVAFTAAVFGWFGAAIGAYTQSGEAVGVTVVLLAAPLLQPQFLAFALVRHVAGRRHGATVRALAATAAWAATEWLAPKLLGDTLGHGLHASPLLRQGADVVGAAGLSALLLLANEGVAAALARRAAGPRAAAVPLALAVAVPLLLAGYGTAALSRLAAAESSASASPQHQPLRMGLVQSNLTDYARLRREQGTHAAVREVLDVHFAMSYDAVERQRVDAVLWSETVYPTTFGQPKSEAGAEFDREILATVDAAGVPFVFGTYDRDAAGEYNAAAFVAPGVGTLGFYRKTRTFPLTEHVPDWLDGPLLRRWLPWAGTWRPGSGARVFPLRLADGREVPVLPLICLDDVDAALAVDGARLGARAIVTMSNDAWFSAYPHGARLHQAAAAFRSIETRLPQFRVTTNGHSAVIHATGAVLAGTRIGERTLVVGELPLRQPPRTLIVAWGDWVGRAGLVGLAVLAATAAVAASGARGAKTALARAAPPATAHGAAPGLPADVAVLPRAARLAAGLLRAFARASLLGIGAAWLVGDVLPTKPLDQLRVFAALFLAPEAAAWCVLRAFAARAALFDGLLVFTRGARRLELALRDIAAVEPWRVPLPAPGATLRLVSGAAWRYGVVLADPAALAAAAGVALRDGAPRAAAYARARAAVPRWRIGRAWLKFGLFPLLLAVPAFRLHQHIAYGSAFGELQTFGLQAYVTAFAMWWASWVAGVLLCAAALRVCIEAGALLTVLLRPGAAVDARLGLERVGLALLYLGLPAVLLWRIFSGS
jgi:apolipoprotein N-acyltransferase